MKHNIEIPSASRLAYLLSLWIVGVIALSYPFLFPPYEDDRFAIPEYSESPMPDFAEMTDIQERKRAFFDYLLPVIHEKNRLIVRQREFLESLKSDMQENKKISLKDARYLEKLVKDYRVRDAKPIVQVDRLIHKIDVIPAELVLMQAANESAWGTSRFAKKGYNFFGLWCFKRGCGFVPKRRNDGAAHEVAKFSSLSQAVNTYFRNINRHNAYRDLRQIRSTLRNNEQTISAEALARGLGSYSERGEDYIEELLQMIRFNRKFMDI